MEIHFGCNYRYAKGALEPKPDALAFIELTLDKRKTVEEFKMDIMEVCLHLIKYVWSYGNSITFWVVARQQAVVGQ